MASRKPERGDEQALANAVIVMVFTMALYNILAVIVLQTSNHSAKGIDWQRSALSILSNPLLLAGLLGLLVPMLRVTLPSFLQRALDALGAAAVPIALMCIGGSLVTAQLRGRRSWIVAAALLKIGVLPGIVFILARLAGLKRPNNALPSCWLRVPPPPLPSSWPARCRR
jgi:predicted permease